MSRVVSPSIQSKYSAQVFGCRGFSAGISGFILAQLRLAQIDDLGGDVGTLLGTAVRMEGAATTAFALRLQSAIIRARTANPGQFDAHGVMEREFAVHREPCGKID